MQSRSLRNASGRLVARLAADVPRGDHMLTRALDRPEVRSANFLVALACLLYVRGATAAAPMTLTCPDAGGAQIFLLDLDNATSFPRLVEGATVADQNSCSEMLQSAQPRLH